VTDYVSNSLNQYTSVGGKTYSYDGNGNLTCDGFYKYYYDCENRLTDVNYANNSRVASYKYDWSGRRVRKIDYTLNPERYTLYCYDGDQVIAEYDENGTLQRKFVYGAGIDEPVAMLIAGSGGSGFQGCEAFSDGVLCQLSHGVQVELVHNLSAVCLDGLGADVEPEGYFFCGAAFGD
jgi:hypothetical protein